MRIRAKLSVSLDWILTGTEQQTPAFTDTGRFFLEQLQAEMKTLSERIDYLEDKIDKQD